ncbi:MAG: hypothetical protein K2X72_24960 [Reyranella sp.]|nr:hypothetical protein [Reyranella sp.]
MGLYWMSANGFTQVAPSTYLPRAGRPAAVNLELVVAGLLGTSSETGTGGTGTFAARGSGLPSPKRSRFGFAQAGRDDGTLLRRDGP